MQGDPRVVAALAIAILAISPVVNAIMTKAAQQADVDLLRDAADQFPFKDAFDQAFRGEPPPGEGPGEGQGAGAGSGHGPRPPPTQLPPPPPCNPETHGPAPEVLSGPTSPPPSGERREVTYEVEPGDVVLVAHIEAQNVVGQPAFALARDGEVVWQNADFHAYESFALPNGDDGVFEDPDVGVTWTLSVETGTAAYDAIALSLAAQRCTGGGA